MERKFSATDVDHMPQKEVVVPVIAEWEIFIVFASKKDGSLQFCRAYRKLKEVKIRDSYLLPRMD